MIARVLLVMAASMASGQDREAVGVDVDQGERAPDRNGGAGRGNERIVWYDDLATLADPIEIERPGECRRNCIGAVWHDDSVPPVTISRKGGAERFALCSGQSFGPAQIHVPKRRLDFSLPISLVIVGPRWPRMLFSISDGCAAVDGEGFRRGQRGHLMAFCGNPRNKIIVGKSKKRPDVSQANWAASRGFRIRLARHLQPISLT